MDSLWKNFLLDDSSTNYRVHQTDKEVAKVKDKSDKVYIADVVRKLDQVLDNEDDFYISRKSSKKSIEARQEGNKLYGSKNHDKEIHGKILALYTKSIAFAENNSEELAMAYGNRSALLFHLHKYKECLIDIERACKITKLDNLEKKLATRKRDCYIQLGKVKVDEQTPPTLKFKPSKEIPCASELVKLQYNEKYGRHVVATQDLEPGTVIAFEKGFALFPEMENLYLNCSHCLSLSWTAIPCHKCTVAVYCSESCKEEAWQQYHDIECSVLPYFDFLDKECGRMINLTLTVRLFIKIVKTGGLANIIEEANAFDNKKDKQINGFFNDDSFQSNTFLSIYNLSYCQNFSLENHLLCSKVMKLLHKKTKIFHDSDDINLKDNQNVFPLKIFEKLMRIVESNAFNFQTFDTTYEERKKNYEGTFLGAIIASFCSLLNHSCVCNVERLFTKNQEILLYTSNFVQKGQQLFVNYGTNDLMTSKERHLYLESTYQFVCDCQACKENWPNINSIVKDFEKQDAAKIYSELAQARVLQTFYKIHKQADKWICNKDTLRETIQIMSIIYKHYKGFKAYSLVHYCMHYIIYYYEIFYAMKNDIPNNC